MTTELVNYQAMGLKKVEPSIAINTRLATQEDFAWIDKLQKSESDKVGFFMEVALRKRIDEGNVVVAEATGMSNPRMMNDEKRYEDRADASTSFVDSDFVIPPIPAGYCLGVDKYMKQDHVGIIYQMTVEKQYRRSLVAATLLQAQFDKSAYGVRLYGCWCKQTLEGNRFWESMGFIPLAFRTGSRNEGKKKAAPETHLYWQKKIRYADQFGTGEIKTGDESPSADPGIGGGWWYPCETMGGLMAESRVVLPIPPGRGWQDAMEVVLPGADERADAVRLLEDQGKAAVDEKAAALKVKRKAAREAKREAERMAKAVPVVEGVAVMRAVQAELSFGLDPIAAAAQEAERKAEDAAAEKEAVKEEKKAARQEVKKARRKSDPQQVAMSREFRDRWQEYVAADPGFLLERAAGKYGVGRLLLGSAGGSGEPGGEMLGDAIPAERLGVRVIDSVVVERVEVRDAA